MKLSLGFVLAACLAGLQFLAILIVMTSSYFTSERALLDHARQLLGDVATNTIEHSKGFLTPARGATELATRLAENQIVSSDNTALLEKLLFQQLQIAPQFAGVYFGDEEGNFVYVMRSRGPGPFRTKIITKKDGQSETELIWRDDDFNELERRFDPEDTYDPRGRPWYQSAKESAALIWTDPYIFFTARTPGITVASPVRKEGNIRGVIGVDIEIAAISNFLNSLNVGETGTAFILNHNGDVIAHPDISLIVAENEDKTLRFLSIDEISDPIARTAFSGLLQDGEIDVDAEISSNFVYDDEAYVFELVPINNENLPWTIAVYAPENDFIAGIKSNRAYNIGIAAGVAALTAFIGLLVARMIHNPVRALAERATQISKGDLEAVAPFPRTFVELESANETMMKEIARRKQSELEYAHTFDLASRGMAHLAPDTGTFLRANKKLCDITGYKPEEILKLSLIDLFDPDDPHQKNVLKQLAAGGDVEYLHEAQIIGKDGGPIWVRINGMPMMEDSGLQGHTVITVEDITEVKDADSQIAKLNSDLAHNARMNTMGEMAAGIAHEINQPLTAITQNADAALSTAQENPNADAELIEILKDLETQAHRAAGIIRSLRGFVKKDGPQKTSVDLNKLFRQTVRLVQAEAKENGVVIEIRPSNVPEVSAVRVQVAQVLVNLLRNAVESIAETPGNNDKRISVWAGYNENGEVTMFVEDTGKGVDPDIALFSQFETTKADGMGLGLSISKGIMEDHGGTLWHEPSPSGSARFCCSFPTKAAA